MDPPPPDNFDPPSAEGEAYAGDNEGDDCDEDGDYSGDGQAPKNRPKRPGRKPAGKRSDFPHEGSMYQRLLEIGLLLISPPRNASPEQMRRHSISMSVAILGIYLHIAFACGWLASIGLSGFARADTVAALEVENKNLRIMSYSTGIREFHRIYCKSDDGSQAILYEHLQRLMASYQNDVGVAYILPACPPR